MDAKTCFSDYVSNPDRFWEGPFLRQADKMAKRLRRIASMTGWSGDEIAPQIWELAVERRGEYPPVYITGLGGSGSHWVSEMLNEIDGFVNCGEVYFPPSIMSEAGAMAAGSVLIDAIHLVHGWPRKPGIERSRMVNSAAGSAKTALYKEWDPGCGVVYLIRDPRDQVLSTTFRKGEYRSWVSPEASDRDYLIQRCRINRADAAGYRSRGVSADVTVRYEDLRKDAAGGIGGLLAAINDPRDELTVAEAVQHHDAEAIRAGAVPSVGNLDLGGGPAGGWRETEIELLAPIHAELGATIELLGYPFGTCLLEPAHAPGTVVPEALPGVTFLAWTTEWCHPAPGTVSDRGLLAVVTEPATMPQMSVDTLCLSRMAKIDGPVLSELLDRTSPGQLDLGGVGLSKQAMEVVMGRLSRLRSLNLLGSVDAEAARSLQSRQPGLTVLA